MAQYKLQKNTAPWAALGKDLYTINGHIRLDWRKSMSRHEVGIENKQKEKII